ncbi:MAG: hypothetical protein L6R42_005665 [Xanthoria sp. 1 TBL-2021]|nr:MAG: hypothetical protein L6R42_005665 [Xanthoria sp. 1 TBL-2021]
MPPRPPPLTAPRNPPSFHRTLLNPLLAKPLAKSLVKDPLVLQLNIDIYMLAPSEHTFGSALQLYITKLDKCEDTNDASAYARACLEVLVVYSLMRMREKERGKFGFWRRKR